MSKRAQCEACLRPTVMCFCDLVQSVPTETRVVIVQHPLETGHSKGTGLLLHRCLPNSAMLIAEQLTPQLVHSQCAGLPPVLLYPPNTGATPYVADAGKQCALIVLDASWRKSRKMLHLNPWLAALPRLSLSDLPPSRYAIRKAHQPEQRSSLEATCAALKLLEPHTSGLEQILHSMDQLVARVQQRFVGAEKGAN